MKPGILGLKKNIFPERFLPNIEVTVTALLSRVQENKAAPASVTSRLTHVQRTCRAFLFYLPTSPSYCLTARPQK